ncbi:thioesterase II family protein [Flavobacterium sp. ZB4P13]|uniref:thioesterase II family protein n=1 Tax=Flavobacterium sp. ZB4P13 TaxID=3401728 RepID=UPI003AAFE226
MRLQLFLLHFAGGSVYSFEFLKRHLVSDIEFIPLELPGRGKRHIEKLLKTLDECVEDYFNQIKNLRNEKPFIIYGHSMGAPLGLYLTSKFEVIGDSPSQLIVSGNAGLGIKKEGEIVCYHKLDDLQFKEKLKKLGGMPNEVFDNEELYNHFAPIIRSDFECVDNLNDIQDNIQINTDIYAIMGNGEETSSKIDNWKRFTKGNFQNKIVSGNHFFIYDHPKEIVNAVVETIDKLKNI